MSTPKATSSRSSPRMIALSNSSKITGVSSHAIRSEEHTSELQSQSNLVCRLLLAKKHPAFIASAPRASPAGSADSTASRACPTHRPAQGPGAPPPGGVQHSRAAEPEDLRPDPCLL